MEQDISGFDTNLFQPDFSDAGGGVIEEEDEAPVNSRSPLYTRDFAHVFAAVLLL